MNLRKLRVLGLGVALVALTLVAGQAERTIFVDGFEFVDQKDEYFDTGDFSLYPWETGGDAPWFVVQEDEVPQSVDVSWEYAAQAGKIEDNGQSWLQVTLFVARNGRINFCYQVSSEADSDFLSFFIDGTEMGKWSGETDWQAIFYLVTAGSHTFRWEYTKNGAGSSGWDTVWVDAVDFPMFCPATPITPGQSIQEAIDNTVAGAMICLGAGEWEENLVITKRVTLVGAGSDNTTIRGKIDRPVIEVRGDAEVGITNLKITKSKGDQNGITISGDASVIIDDCSISENGWNGIEVENSAWAWVSESTIKNNRYVGIVIGGELSHTR